MCGNSGTNCNIHTVIISISSKFFYLKTLKTGSECMGSRRFIHRVEAASSYHPLEGVLISGVRPNIYIFLGGIAFSGTYVCII